MQPVFRFIKDRYPITLTIKPVQGMDAQISMLENVEEVGYRSPDASMTWIFEDGVLETKVTGGTFTISKTLRGKIENVLVKMIAYWQQYFFRDVMEKNALRPGVMPVIDEDEVKKLSGGRVFFNKLKGLAFREGNAAAIKKRMLDERFAGINANKMFVSDAFLRECREEGVDVSVFTLNTEEDAKRYAGMELYNLTCNNPACVRAVYEGLR